MVLEYGDIDLARLLHNHEENKRRDRAAAAAAGVAEGQPSLVPSEDISGGNYIQMDENFVRLYWQQMLQVLHHTIYKSIITYASRRFFNPFLRGCPIS